MKNPIVLALDIDDPNQALALAQQLGPKVGAIKIGPRLTFRMNPEKLRDLTSQSLVFFDHKFFDIPSTVESSVQAAFDLGVHWVTVHALNGRECLERLALLEKKLKKSRPEFRILVVTVLTSFSTETLPPIWKEISILESVSELVKQAYESGLTSFVCSPHEIQAVKSAVKGEAFIVTPGVRLSSGSSHDQKRTATPHEAMALGANALVIGRPILEAPSPDQCIDEILGAL
ncbi:MAG: orotidine-5'-phosphate decarboxylase [Oligoflexia bacterium]|nr:orotidine-5'-phosphate decarboxylase [Oligoflexia bacterium]